MDIKLFALIKCALLILALLMFALIYVLPLCANSANRDPHQQQLPDLKRPGEVPSGLRVTGIRGNT